MSDGVGLAVGVALLLGTLALAVVRPRGLPEAVGAVPAAVLAVVLGVLPWGTALKEEVSSLAPTVGFLAAVLLIADLCERDGLFTAAGARLVHSASGRPVPFLRSVFLLGAGVTAILSLDATVVLLTPVVIAAVARSRLRPRPHVYACAHLANSASLLLPVSNLTNLLAYRASGLSFVGFGVLMAAPCLVTLLIEYGVFRRFFADDLGQVVEASPQVGVGTAADRAVPRYPLVVLGVTLVGFAATSFVGVDPALVAAAGAVALAVPTLRAGRVRARELVAAADLPFLAFVLGLGVVVRGVQERGLGRLVAHLMPDGSTLLDLLVVAGIAAVLANLLNNLPATLLLLPATSAAGVPALMAMLVGVNIGPNLTYVGSLATLLWKRLLHERDVVATQAEFLRLGLLTVPTALLGATLTLWAVLHWTGATR